jgi:hypothetical protein
MMRHCPRCDQSLPLESFGICKARKDGLNLYCHSCCRNAVSAQRKVVREMKRNREAGRKNSPIDYPRIVLPEMKVLRAIRRGARTQLQIARQSRLPFDQLGDALAELILIQGKVGTKVIGERREYFVRAA